MCEVRGILKSILARVAFSALFLIYATGTWSQEMSDQRTVRATFNDTDIRQVILAVGEITGKKFVIDQQVNGLITLDIGAPVTLSEFYDLFLSNLHAHGYETVSDGEVIHVVPVGTGPAFGSISPATTADVSAQSKGIVPDIKLLAEAIRPTPYFVDGQIPGYRFYPGPDRAKFVSFGLRPGDLVINYDGLPLDDASALIAFAQAMTNSEVKYLTVERKGETFTLPLD